MSDVPSAGQGVTHRPEYVRPTWVTAPKEAAFIYSSSQKVAGSGQAGPLRPGPVFGPPFLDEAVKSGAHSQETDDANSHEFCRDADDEQQYAGQRAEDAGGDSVGC
jgi:hypothetical protein